MVLEVWTGVTSRIYTVSDAVAMCRETGEKLVVYWPIEGDCHIRMEDVFQIADDIEVEVHNFYHVRHYKPIDVRKSIGQSIKALMQDIPIWFYNKLIATDLEKIKEKCEYSFSFSPPREVGWGGSKWQEYIIQVYNEILRTRQKNDIKDIYIHAYCGIRHGDNVKHDLKCIKFNAVLYERAKEIMGEAYSDVIGIHIRRTDHKVAMQGSPLEKFYETMRNLVKENGNIKFFLSTDDINVQRELQKEFGDKIIVQNKVWGRDSKEGIESAIVDGLCLSKCAVIYGSYTSAYSHFWAEYGDVRLIIV